MPAKRKPSYLLHKPTGQARVLIDGRDHYLGTFGSPESRDRYDDRIAEWLSRQCVGRVTLTVDELVLLYLKFAEGYYVKDGRKTAEVDCIRAALRPLIRRCSTSRIREFSPSRLKAVRQAMIDSGQCRTTINRNVDRIHRMFRWAVAEDLLPSTVYDALTALPGLRKGKTAAREPRPVGPVPDATLEATLTHLPIVVADLVRFQRLTGCRPGEVCQLRPCDLDRSGEVWVYRPASHKAEHHDRERRIFVGPQAQAVLLPYLLRAPEANCFAPAESERRRRAKQHAQRKTPISQGNRPGTNQSVAPRRQAKAAHTEDSYCRAIVRACEAAFHMPAELRKIPKGVSAEERARMRKAAAAWRKEHCWSPNQLRRAAATQIRQRFGLEAAQASLGHSAADVTQIYAERDFGLAASVARQIG